MLSDEVRARIALLTAPAARGESLATRPVPAHLAGAALQPLRFVPAPLLSAGEPCENGSGEHLRFRRPLAELWPAADDVADRAAHVLRSAALPAVAHPELAAVAEHFPVGTMFLDLETCGFAGAPIFLAGLVWRSAGVLVLDQLFARHYGEERALLETLATIAGAHQVLATFNGKSFDWPMVRDRSTRHRLGQRPIRSLRKRAIQRPDELTHCDLLHHARRRWKRVLPDCKLQTLERYVCRRVRHDDLPGSEVPAAYHQFVRTGASEPIRSILHHNALDLLTLVQVTLKLLDVASPRQEKLSEAG